MRRALTFPQGFYYAGGSGGFFVNITWSQSFVVSAHAGGGFILRTETYRIDHTRQSWASRPESCNKYLYSRGKPVCTTTLFHVTLDTEWQVV